MIYHIEVEDLLDQPAA